MLSIENLYYNNPESNTSFKVPYAKINDGDAVIVDAKDSVFEILADILLGRLVVADLKVKIDEDEIDLKKQSKVSELTSANFLYSDLTLRENIYYFCKLLNFTNVEISNKINWLLHYFDIFPSLDKKTSICTEEERFVIHLFITLVKLPKILILNSLPEFSAELFSKEKYVTIFHDLQTNGMSFICTNGWNSYFKECISELKINTSCD